MMHVFLISFFKRLLLLMATLLLWINSTTVAWAQKELFLRRSYINAQGDTLKYRWYAPQQKGEKKLPLVVFLHGAGERGSDNEAQLCNGIFTFVDSANQAKRPAFVLAPQCPSGKKWVNVDWKLASNQMPDSVSVPLGMLLELVKQYKDSLFIDDTRIYIAGLSMGGFGTWDAICREPALFAAALAVCGGGDEKMVSRIKDLPVWAFHGSNDKVIIPQRSANMVAALKKAGNKKVKYTVYPKVGHNSWTPTFANPAVHQWLFQQRKK
jgi:predicted peptidase